MTREELLEIIEILHQQKTDMVHIEAKRARNALPKGVRETLSAFSNSPGGGIIILGLDEESGFQATGVADPKKMQADLASLCDQLEPTPRPFIQIFEVDGQHLVTAEVAELAPEQKPCYYKGQGLTNGAYLRVGDGDRTLTPYEVQVLLEVRSQPRYDVEPVRGTSMSDLRADLVQSLVQNLREREGGVYTDWSDEKILQALGVLVEDPNGALVASLFGLLLFAAYPQERFPSLCITFMRYPTPRLGESGPGGERFLDNVKVEGPLPYIVVETLRVIKRNMQRRGIVQGLFREDLWEYPETVLREAIVNALGHRDLSPQARRSQVQVQMFPDRLEIVNPGGLFGPIQPDQLGQIGVQSSRNEFLMKVLEDLPAPRERRSLCENRGTGLATMLEQLRQAGMSPPEFAVSLTTFRLVLPNHTLFDQETLAWLARAGRNHSLAESQRQALAYLRHATQISNADYHRITGVDSRVATKELTDLVNRGLIERQRVQRWVTYTIVKGVGRLPPENTTAVSSSKTPGERIVALLQTSEPLLSREIAEQLNVTQATTRSWLRKLRNQGSVVVIVNNPNNAGTRYAVADEAQ